MRDDVTPPIRKAQSERSNAMFQAFLDLVNHDRSLSAAADSSEE